MNNTGNALATLIFLLVIMFAPELFIEFSTLTATILLTLPKILGSLVLFTCFIVAFAKDDNYLNETKALSLYVYSYILL